MNQHHYRGNHRSRPTTRSGRRSIRRAAARRRGITIIVVLALLAMTLTLAYAAMRTETTVNQVQINFDRRVSARQAALSGLTYALHEMTEAGWAGVDVPLSGNLGNNLTFSVTFQAGDESLKPADADYHEYPYRVTVKSVGTYTDPGDATVTSSHTIQAVMQLIRRHLAPSPANWSALTGNTAYHWATASTRPAQFELPGRVEGQATFQSELLYADDYPPSDSRPFAGTIDEVAIWATALSSSDFKKLADKILTPVLLTSERVGYWRFDELAGATTAADAWGGHHGFVDGATMGATPVLLVGGLGAAHFDGFNDQVYLGDFDIQSSGGAATSQMSISAWFKADHFGEPEGRILSKAAGSATADHYWMLSTVAVSGEHRLRFRLKTTSLGTVTLIATSGNIPTGQWVHAGAEYDGSKIKLYLNGDKVGQLDSVSGAVARAPGVGIAVGGNPPGNPRGRLLRDLNAMRLAGQGDYRPLTGPVDMPHSMQPAETLSLLQNETALTVNDLVQAPAPPLTHPGDITAYRLYPGGPEYSVPTVASSLANIKLAPDPLSNPLGIFKRADTIYLDDNVSIEGILLTTGGVLADLTVRGDNVSLTPVVLPSVDGDPKTYELPITLLADDLKIEGGTQTTFEGVAIAWDDVHFLPASQSVAYDHQGSVLAADFKLASRTEWDLSDTWWKDRLQEFMNQLDDNNAEPYFPVWLKNNYKLDYVPNIQLRPSTSGRTPYWPDWTQPLFTPHPDDNGGLRWDLVDWQDLGVS